MRQSHINARNAATPDMTTPHTLRDPPPDHIASYAEKHCAACDREYGQLRDYDGRILCVYCAPGSTTVQYEPPQRPTTPKPQAPTPPRDDGPLWRCAACDRPVEPAPVSIERGWRTICSKCDAAEASLKKKK